MEYTPITDIEKIDLTRHAIIEASAGTGKTYTIENLVARMLIERPEIELENILLVTFTEKAACELKMRIRDKLETELAKIADTGRRERIENALDSFDSASIHTIHGFCQSVLNDYAFENGAPFQMEVVDDALLFERLLKEQIRKTWVLEFGEHLPDLLELSGFGGKKEKFESLILSAALSFKECSGDRMHPCFDHDSLSKAGETIGKMRKLVRELKQLAGDGYFCRGFEDLNYHKTKKNNLMANIVEPLSRFLPKIDPDRFKLSALMDIFSYIKKNGIECLQPEYLKKGSNPEACPHWEIVAKKLSLLHECYLFVKDALAAGSIYRLQRDARAEKAKKGWISFDDMLFQVRDALFSAKGDQLADTLRKKYKAAFVDEFQDTDPVQWQIFKRIFLHGENEKPENPLFVIGDPKQAIYAFRGADVYAYLGARNEMERLSRIGLANCYSLSVNWRSDPSLIHAFNCLFPARGWFAPDEEKNAFSIGYLPVNAPDEGSRKFSIERDDSGCGFLNIVDLNDSSPKEKPSLAAAKPALARFVAEEIRRLAAPGTIRHGKKGEESFDLSYSDICILVRGKNEAPFLEEELRRLNIPYSYYKKPGLFFSDEAFHLGLVFRAILNPGDVSSMRKALLTPFFAFEPDDLHFVEELAPSHPVKSLFFEWGEKAATRRWGRLFQSLMEDSGLAFRESGKLDWERSHTNYRQIFEHLHDVAYRGNLDFRGIAAVLDGYRKGTATAEGGVDLHQIETEDEKVKIMTMHVAKGLEFPIVFVCGGITQPGHSGNGYCLFHEIPNDGSPPYKVFDLSESIGKERQQRENADEDRRLYYVALTRARLKLYCPYREWVQKQHWVGPVSRIVTPALNGAFGPDSGFSETEFPDCVAWHRPEFIEKGDDSAADPNGGKNPGKAEVAEEERNSDSGAEGDTVFPTPLFPETPGFLNRKIELASFSSIHRMIAGRGASAGTETFGFSALAEKPREDDEIVSAGPVRAEEGSGGAEHIPGGTETGSMFHDILENIDFQIVLNAPEREEGKKHPLLEDPGTRELIERQMELYRVDPLWIEPVCDVVFNTLRTPIPRLSESFSLASLSKEDRLHEAEFYFPHPMPYRPDIPECETCEGYVRGFVDLIFKHEGKFYVADWKSNILEDGYGQPSLEASMKRSGYDLQYRIYTVATLRWLSSALGDRFDPDRDFGGVFYFYLRGMGGKNGEGVYHVPAADLRPLGELERGLLEGRRPGFE